MTTKYPGVAYRLGTWFGTKVRLVRLQSLGPKVSEIVDFRDFFFVYCGAGFEGRHVDIAVPCGSFYFDQ